jgi:NAD(P)-dependent dehydrogenase (short-subunit alcohol dehydrogenase family)
MLIIKLLSTLGEEIDNIKHQLLSLFEKIDVLINNAGFLVVEEFMKISAKNARLVMETNFFGPATLIRMLVPLMKEGSHIVNISSMGGFQGSVKYKGLAYYSSSKAALATLTECLAVELTDRGISANCLALGSVQTEMFETAFKGLRAPVEPESMSEFISWFALNGHKFFNGKILPVALGNP